MNARLLFIILLVTITGCATIPTGPTLAVMPARENLSKFLSPMTPCAGSLLIGKPRQSSNSRGATDCERCGDWDGGGSPRWSGYRSRRRSSWNRPPA